jgi:hypothetical protein
VDTSQLALDLYEALPAGGVVFVASDKAHVAEDMCTLLEGLQTPRSTGTGGTGGAGDFEGLHASCSTGSGAARDVEAVEERRCFRRVSGDAAADAALRHALCLGADVPKSLTNPDSIAHKTKPRESTAQAAAPTRHVDPSIPIAASGAGAGGGGRGGSGDPAGHDAPGMGPDRVWLGRNVFGRPTERERICEQPDRHGALREVRRALFVRLP